MAKTMQNPYSPHRSSGVTLIEVLVALFVLSIGLIGIAALQASALQANHGSQLRSQATNLSYDIADRMRTNRQAALNNDYVGEYEAVGCPNDSEDIPDFTGSLAERDIAEWRIALACGLPNGRAEISRSGNEFVIRIRWDNDRLAEDEAEEVETFVTRTEI
ncbi:type IV pilus modification protein PilV [Ectothiorhodospira variabilis]|uniref:type IV pilus modification protein PilV n=1 Tax=Ectothiorhodospira variabilis TaxID=505694 RepID=UPI001EFBC47B|nr:type IV pilus modification protein PilV [Ectothiorhodospira variabilis]MCG5496890.1 type IV pilus modification protein PilV [Ectothiorhodospira variabilis]